jgi:hypothetical protein
MGGSYGKGQVYRGGDVSGTSTVVEVSIGIQLGAKAFGEIIFFQDKRAYHELTGGDTEPSPTVSGCLQGSAAPTAGPCSIVEGIARRYTNVNFRGWCSSMSIEPCSGTRHCQLSMGWII